MTNILVIEKNHVFREGLTTFLSRAGHNVVDAIESIAAYRPAFISNLPDLVIVGPESAGDVVGDSSPFEAMFPASHEFFSVLLLDLGAPGIRQSEYSAYDAVLSKDVTDDVLTRSIELVIAGHRVFHAFAKEKFTALQPPTARPASSEQHLTGKSSLSGREIQTLRSLVNGAPNKMIAQQLSVTEATIKARIKSLLRKIGVANRTQIALWAVNHPEILLESDAEMASDLPDRSLGLAEAPTHPRH